MRKMSYVMTLALLAMPAAAMAQTGMAQDDGVRGKWSAVFAGGAAVPVGGDLHQGGRGTVLGLPTTVDAKTNTDVFDAGFAWRAGVGYGVARNVEVFGDFGWKRTDATELSVGNVAGLDLRAQFGDYTSYGMEGGLRFHFAPGAPVNPYISALGGFRRVEAIPGTFLVPAAGVTLPDTPFYDDTTVGVVGSDFGVLFGVSERLSLGVEAGFRYHGDLDDIEGLSGTGLENLNDVGNRWSVPVSAVLRINF